MGAPQGYEEMATESLGVQRTAHREVGILLEQRRDGILVTANRPDSKCKELGDGTDLELLRKFLRTMEIDGIRHQNLGQCRTLVQTLHGIADELRMRDNDTHRQRAALNQRFSSLDQRASRSRLVLHDEAVPALRISQNATARERVAFPCLVHDDERRVKTLGVRIDDLAAADVRRRDRKHGESTIPNLAKEHRTNVEVITAHSRAWERLLLGSVQIEEHETVNASRCGEIDHQFRGNRDA